MYFVPSAAKICAPSAREMNHRLATDGSKSPYRAVHAAREVALRFGKELARALVGHTWFSCYFGMGGGRPVDA